MSFFTHVIILIAATTSLGVASTSCPSTAEEDTTALFQSGVKLHLGSSHASNSEQNTAARPSPEDTLEKEADEVLKIVSQSESELGDKATGLEARESANGAIGLDSSSLQWATGYAKASSKSGMKLISKADHDGDDDAEADAAAEAEAKPLNYRLCGSADPKHLGITEVDSPDPAYAGSHVALTVRGVAGTRFEKGTAKLSVMSMGMKVGSLTFDVCKHMGITCPLNKGDSFAGTFHYSLPPWPVPGSAPCSGRLTVTSLAGDHQGEFGCITTDIMVASNGTSPFR
jgi:hypothetical protein